MDVRRKLALFCNVEVGAVIEALDVETIYDVPMRILDEKLDVTVISKLRLMDRREPDLKAWKNFLNRHKNPKHEVRIGLVGKYNELPDAYKSIYESFIHAGAQNECRVVVEPIHSEQLDVSPAAVADILHGLDGILVAPGFGERGIEGKIKAIRHVREKQIPFFGICLGMQCAVVEYSRHVLGLGSAASAEVDPDTENPVIDMMAEQKQLTNKGGTMRLGAYDCQLLKKSRALKAYGNELISERHRHRFEFNNEYRERLEKAGLRVTGVNPQNNLVEIVEIPEHPWFVGVQFHPELKSTVEKPHPLFVAFVKACKERRGGKHK
jgi:CTP synthase